MGSKKQSAKTIERQIKDKENELHKLKDKKLAIARKTLIFCQKCRKRSRVFSWSFIQNFYYVRPYGCTEGDYWVPENTETCDMKCPKCGHENYIYNHPQKSTVVELEVDNVFKEVIDRKN